MSTYFRGWIWPLAVWVFFGLVIFVFGLPLRYHLGLLVELLKLAWFVWAIFMIGIGLLIHESSWKKLFLSVLIFGLAAAIVSAAPYLEHAGDRTVFETRYAHYERAIAKLQTGEAPETACAEFRFSCGVSWKEGLRVAFYHPEFFDKYIGYVYDPSGVYATIHELAEQDYERYREEYWGELVPGIVMLCRPIRIHYYRCFFS